MFAKNALKKIRELILNRITRTGTYVSDLGIIKVADDAIKQIDEQENAYCGEITGIRDALSEALNLIDQLRTSDGKPCNQYCGECSSVETGCHILQTKKKIQDILDNPQKEVETLMRMFSTIKYIRDAIVCGKVSDEKGNVKQNILSELVNQCDSALKLADGASYGSMSKMRDVLWTIRNRYLLGYPGTDWVKVSGEDYRDLHNLINEALAEPVRNCEVFRDFNSSWKEYCRTHRMTQSTQLYVDWLINESVNNEKNGWTGSRRRNCDKYKNLDVAKAVYKDTVQTNENGTPTINLEEWLYLDAE